LNTGTSIKWIGVFACVALLSGCFPKVSIPKNISSVAEGYPYAQQLKQQIAPEAELILTQVYLDRKNNHLGIDTINYCFVSQKGKGRTIIVTLVNRLHEAGVSRKSSGAYHDAYLSPAPLRPLNLSLLDLPEILGFAATNGLNDFCARAPGESGSISLTLLNSTNGARWFIFGNADKDDIPGLHLLLDGQTGAVINDDFEKSGRR
jgi:hypothetical protein